MPNHLTPRIAGDWRLLFKPRTFGRYVNDHSLVRGADGLWHLFGITSHAEADFSERERYFVHARGKLLGEPEGMTELGKVCDNGVRAWAPGVVFDGTRYFMHYGPSPMRMATSFELGHWMEHTPVVEGAPLDSCHRDSMVFRRDEETWLMYVTGIDGRYGVVSVLESNDLVRWRFLRFALRTSGNAPYNPPWGATESPFVVHRDGLYYLFITYTDCAPENYHNTLVFRSEDPTDFGEYTGDNEEDLVIAKLHAHAPEIIEEDGRWFITTCGWPGRNTPVEGGVAVAPLEW